MNDGILKQFAAAMLTVGPDIPMSAQEIESEIKESGLGNFMERAGGQAAELAETAELLSRLGGGG